MHTSRIQVDFHENKGYRVDNNGRFWELKGKHFKSTLKRKGKDLLLTQKKAGRS